MTLLEEWMVRTILIVGEQPRMAMQELRKSGYSVKFFCDMNVAQKCGDKTDGTVVMVLARRRGVDVEYDCFSHPVSPSGWEGMETISSIYKAFCCCSLKALVDHDHIENRRVKIYSIESGSSKLELTYGQADLPAQEY